MQLLPPLIFDLAVMLGIASVITLFFQRIGQPVVLGYLVAGIIIGPYTPPQLLVNDIPNIKILSELGVIFLLFSLGLEFTFHKLTRVGFSATVTGVLEVVLMTAIGFGTGRMMGWSFNNSLFLGASLAISSTTIIIKAIEELGLMKRRFAELMFGVLIAEDLLAILLLAMLSTVIINQDFFSFDIFWIIIKLILIIEGWFVTGYFLIRPLYHKLMSHANEESITIVSVSACLLFASIAAYLHYSIALGAFIMGSLLAETKAIHRIKTLIQPIRDIFAAVFFTATGMLVNPYIIFEQWPTILIISLVTIFGKILSTSFSAFFTGQRLEISLRIGLAMAQIGEFSFIIIGVGVSLNIISESLYPIIVAVSVITTFTTPYLIRFSEHLTQYVNKNLSEHNKLLLENYSSTISRGLAIISHSNYCKDSGIRLLINGTLIAILFTLSYQLLLPRIHDVIGEANWSKTLCWTFALLLSSPFLWGMIFSCKIQKEFISNKSLNLYSIGMFFLTTSEIILLSLIYFQTWPVVTALFLIMVLFLAISYKILEKTYLSLENYIIKSVKNRHKKSRDYQKLAPWDTYLVEISVGIKNKFINNQLKNSQICQTFGINIIAIQRNQKIIFSPNGKEILLPHDRIVVLGEEVEIEKFRKKIEDLPIIQESMGLLENIVLKAIFLSRNSVFVGKTIRESKIKEHGSVVGLERNGNRILNPDASTLLIENDILFVAGETEYLESID